MSINNFVRVALITVAVAILIVLAVANVSTANNKNNLCQTNGYASYVTLVGEDYCYRLMGGEGELKRIDLLPKEKD